MKSECYWTLSKIAPFVCLRKWTYESKGFPARLWSLKWTLRQMVADLLTLTVILDGHQIPSTLPIPDHSHFQTLPFLLCHPLLSARMTFRLLLPLYLILRSYFETRARPPCCCLVSIVPVFRFRGRSGPVFKSFKLSVLFFAWHYADDIYTEGSMYSWHARTRFEALPDNTELHGRKTNRATGLASQSQGHAREL